MNEKMPFMRIYVGDELRSGINDCSLEADGLWKRMRMIMHDSEKVGYLQIQNKPMTDEFVAKKCGVGVELYRKLLNELFARVIPPPTPTGILCDPLMVAQEKKRIDGQDYGRKGGNPKLVEGSLKGGLRVALRVGDKGSLKPKSSHVMSVSDSIQSQSQGNNIPPTPFQGDGGASPPDGASNPTPTEPKPYEVKTTMQKLTCGWKVLCGVEHDDRDWDRLNYSRARKSLTEILAVFAGDHVMALDCLQDIVEELKKKGLEFSLERAVKSRVIEWKNRNLQKV